VAPILTAAIQFANLLIPVYLYLRRKLKFEVHRFIFFILVLCCLVSISIAISWEALTRDQSPQENNNLIIYLGVFSFLSGVTGCLSNVSFWEFTSQYHPNLITALAVGAAFSAIFPALISAFQNPGPSSRFDLPLFFVLQTILLVFPLLAFIAIMRTPSIRELRRDRWAGETRQLTRPLYASNPDSDVDYQFQEKKSRASSPSTIPSPPRAVSPTQEENGLGIQETFLEGQGKGNKEGKQTMSSEEASERSRLTPFPYSKSTYSSTSDSGYDLPEPSSKDISVAWKDLLVMFWISLVTYTFPGLITYLFVDFRREEQALFYSIVAGMLGGTIGRILSGFINHVPHLALIVIQLFLGITFILGYPLGWPDWLSWVLVAVSFLFALQFGLQSTLLFKNASMHIDHRFAQKLCRWLGALEQLGAFLAAVFTLGLVFGGVFD